MIISCRNTGCKYCTKDECTKPIIIVIDEFGKCMNDTSKNSEVNEK